MKRLLIDAVYKEEVRVAITNDNKLEKFETELLSKKNIQGNIFLAKIVRIEPSLQAAFVEYGGNRHGFLSLSEVHPNYFQIPQEDKQTLEEHIKNVTAFHAEKKHHADQNTTDQSTSQEEKYEYVNYPSGEDFDELTSDEASLHREICKIRSQFFRKYRIQEILKKRQVLLVQVMKEERSNKGAALTTYISISGKYCVLMPNSQKPNGISKRITSAKDRARLKEIIQSLVPSNDMCAVIRTEALNRTKKEIAADFNFLLQTWQEICKKTLQSLAPCLIYEDMSLIGRTIRDMYNSDIEEIIVEGEEGYKTTKHFVSKIISKRHSSKVRHYTDHAVPLFNKYKVNEQIASILDAKVDLPSGGSIVIGITEALVAIDVNSGKSTRERNINETALKTNIEAAAEIARQCILRDLGGLIVIDFIDMSETKHQQQVCKAVQEAFKHDKASLQIGNISDFGLLELSRQRMKTTILDDHTEECPHCKGTGVVWGIDMRSLQIMRKIEEFCGQSDIKTVHLTLSSDMAFYIFNHKREFINNIEKNGGFRVFFKIDEQMLLSDYAIEAERIYIPTSEQKILQQKSEDFVQSSDTPHENKNRKKRRRKKNKDTSSAKEEIASEQEELIDTTHSEISNNLDPKNLQDGSEDIQKNTSKATNRKKTAVKSTRAAEKNNENNTEAQGNTQNHMTKKRRRRKKTVASEDVEGKTARTADTKQKHESISGQNEYSNDHKVANGNQDTNTQDSLPVKSKTRSKRSGITSSKKRNTKQENSIENDHTL